ncbi:hypothetical protein J4447_00095 [Candidatus Pacearchaeota archaeon]|nr:hypothetical protein [Candidatus Pacearchaeota archaeon]
MINKRGAEGTPTGTIVVLIIGLVVLVLIIVGFSMGWNNLFSKIFGFGGGKSNVGSVSSNCVASCQLNDQYSFCTEERSVTLGNGTTLKGSCNQFATMDNLKSQIGGAIKECPGLCIQP